MPLTAPTPPAERRQFLSSELSRNSRTVMDAAETGPVCIDRRDGHPLVLMSQQEADAKDALLALAAQLIAATLDDDRGSLGDRLADRFDWMLALPQSDREQCAAEVVRAARASFSTGQAHLAVAELASWRSTAEAVAAGWGSEPVEWLDDARAVERP